MQLWGKFEEAERSLLATVGTSWSREPVPLHVITEANAATNRLCLVGTQEREHRSGNTGLHLTYGSASC